MKYRVILGEDGYLHLLNNRTGNPIKTQKGEIRFRVDKVPYIRILEKETDVFLLLPEGEKPFTSELSEVMAKVLGTKGSLLRQAIRHTATSGVAFAF